jgi:hypothetical protein
MVFIIFPREFLNQSFWPSVCLGSKELTKKEIKESDIVIKKN